MRPTSSSAASSAASSRHRKVCISPLPFTSTPPVACKGVECTEGDVKVNTSALYYNEESVDKQCAIVAHE